MRTVLATASLAINAYAFVILLSFHSYRGLPSWELGRQGYIGLAAHGLAMVSAVWLIWTARDDWDWK